MLHHFTFIFFKECFLIHSVILKRALFKARKSWIFKIFFWDQFYRLEDANRNALDLNEFRNQDHYRKFLRE